MNRKPCLSGIFLIVEMLALLAGEKVVERTRQGKANQEGLWAAVHVQTRNGGSEPLTLERRASKMT